MQMTSMAAWNSLTNLFEILRNEEDHGNLPRSYMAVPTGLIADGLTEEQQNGMVAQQKVDRSHPTVSTLGLRDALNKIAHYRTAVAAYRVDGRGAHYLVLGGSFRNRRWVAEILVSRLCRNASIAADAITGF